MKFISRATVSQTANLMIGSGLSANSARSLFSHETGIVFSSIAANLETEIEVERAETMGVGNNRKEKPMLILVILAIVVGALLTAAVTYTQRSRKNKEPIQLGVGRKLRR